MVGGGPKIGFVALLFERVYPLLSASTLFVNKVLTFTLLFSCLPQCQELCRKLHKQIDLVDEERYDMEIKVQKSNKEVRLLKFSEVW